MTHRQSFVASGFARSNLIHIHLKMLHDPEFRRDFERGHSHIKLNSRRGDLVQMADRLVHQPLKFEVCYHQYAHDQVGSSVLLPTAKLPSIWSSLYISVDADLLSSNDDEGVLSRRRTIGSRDASSLFFSCSPKVRKLRLSLTRVMIGMSCSADQVRSCIPTPFLLPPTK
jgi:hypothetical protein